MLREDSLQTSECAHIIVRCARAGRTQKKAGQCYLTRFFLFDICISQEMTLNHNFQ